MAKMTKIKDHLDRVLPLRVTERKGSKRNGPRFRIKCGCCNEAVEIYHDLDSPKESRYLEINGVYGSVVQWKKILLPLLE